MADTPSVLIANRGEIACRVIESVKARGYTAVAVFSDADAQARHVRMADQAVHIGASPAAESYLCIDRILDAARRSGARMIHPGYGFLSENSAFAEACDAAGITFIGPPASVIALMGNKRAAKIHLREAGVPCVPGYDGDAQDDATLAAEAAKIGFPVLIKPSAGGGGRGMRLVLRAEEMLEALGGARSEAVSAFGSDELVIEKALTNPRHVEVQILGDQQGNVIHLGERDCSVQRRHQKVIEESPCPALNPELREALGTAAVKAARAVGYYSAGTVEFLVEASGGFYFLEMNTRLQVEHPVTELVTGRDLVALQLSVAEGRALGIRQEEVTFRGHAIEARLYAEDAYDNFLPQTGRVLLWAPAQGDGIRIDHGLHVGMTVSPYYDPLLAKIVAYGETREQARTRLQRAVEDTSILGVTTNKRFLYEILGHEAFAKGEATTGFIASNMGSLTSSRRPSRIFAVLVAAALIEQAAQGMPTELRNWRSSGIVVVPIVLESHGETLKLEVRVDGSTYTERIDDADCAVEISSLGAGTIEFIADNSHQRAHFVIDQDQLFLESGGHAATFTDVTYAAPSVEDRGRDGIVRAPMNGGVVDVRVAPGDLVVKGQVVAIVEAMKIQQQLLAPHDGCVEQVLIEVGGQVEARQAVVVIAVT